MTRRNSLWNRNKEENQPLPAPQTPSDQKASCKKGLSIDQYISDPSPQWTNKEHRWSFSSNMSNDPSSIYVDCEKDGTPKKPERKKRGKRPKPLLSKKELESIEAYSSSEESEMSDIDPITNEKRYEEPKIQTKKKNPADFISQSMRQAQVSSVERKPDYISQSLRDVPIKSGGERTGLKKTRSLETAFSRKPMRRATSARNIEPDESSANHKRFSFRPQLSRRSQSTRNLDGSNRDASLDPSDLRKPPRRSELSRNEGEDESSAGSSSSKKKSDEVMNRSDSEMTRIRARLEKIKSSRSLEESNRSRKEVRSADRMTMKKNRSSRRLNHQDSSFSEEESPEEIKAKLGGSLPDLSLDSSVIQRSKKTNSKSTETEVSEFGADLSLDSAPGPKRTSSSRDKFQKSRFSDSDEGGKADAMQMWSARMKSNVVNGGNNSDKSMEESPDRRKTMKRTKSARREKLVKGNSLPDLSLDAPFDPRKRTSKPKSRSSINVCSDQGGSFGGRMRQKPKQRSRSLDHDDAPWIHSSESDLSLGISEGLESLDRTLSNRNLNESTENESQGLSLNGARVRRRQKQRSRSMDTTLGGSEGLGSIDPKSIVPNDPTRKPSFRLGATRKVPSARNLNLASDHSQNSAARKSVQKTRSDENLRASTLERRAPTRTTSVRDMNSSNSSLRIDSAGQLTSTGRKSLSRRSSQDSDDLSSSERSFEDDVRDIDVPMPHQNVFEMLEDGLAKSINRLQAASRRRKDLDADDDEEDVPEKKVTSETKATRTLDPAASTKNITEVIDDIAEALEETDRLKRIMEVESVLHKLNDAFHQFYTKIDDDPMRATILEEENEVMRIRLQQQDELLKKYKNRLAETAKVEQSAKEEKENVKSAEQMKQELEELKAKLTEKEKTIEEQASRCSKMEAEMVQLQKQAQSGKEVPSLEKRIWQLEKEKTAFMTEISRLHKSNFDSSELTANPDGSATSISTSDLSDQGAGFVGWLMGGPTVRQ